MDTWNAFLERVAARRWVSTPHDARAVDLPESTYHRRTGPSHQSWQRPYHRVRVAPWAADDRETALMAAVAACPRGAAAAGRTAAWLHGLDDERVSFDIVVPHASRVPDLGRHRAVRARWLAGDDVEEHRGIPCLAVPATVVSRVGEPIHRLRGYVIDAVQGGLTTLEQVEERVAVVPHVARRRDLATMFEELAGRAPESVFHDLVLTDLQARGYEVDVAPRHIPTPDGRGVLCDIAIPAFHVALEPEGDRWHRTRSQRRSDRRRIGQYAGTTWAPVPIDWDDWHGRRDWVLALIDAALLTQLERGIGSWERLPVHLQDRVEPSR